MTKTQKSYLKDHPIPEGYQIFEERLEIAGLYRRKGQAIDFVKNTDIWLEFEREPGNEYDSNAIKVLGCTKKLFGTKKYFLGYVPKEVAQAIVKAQLDNDIQPRLEFTSLSDTNYVDIIFQVLGPKEKKAQYRR